MVILSAMRAVIDNLRVVLHVEEHLHLEVVSSRLYSERRFWPDYIVTAVRAQSAERTAHEICSGYFDQRWVVAMTDVQVESISPSIRGDMDRCWYSRCCAA